MKRAEVFSKVVSLKGSKTVLKPLELKMAKELFAATEQSQKELHVFMPWENKAIEDARRFIRLSIRQRRGGTALNLSIHERKSDKIIGTIGIHRFDPFTPSCETGYWVMTSECSNGYATDALLTLLKFCKTKLAMVRVDGRTAVENIASQKVLLKCGFVEEGFQKKAELCHGVWHDLKLFGKILR
jgi:ribosomal-protein-alanine N-acetyltransferase